MSSSMALRRSQPEPDGGALASVPRSLLTTRWPALRLDVLSDDQEGLAHLGGLLENGSSPSIELIFFS